MPPERFPFVKHPHPPMRPILLWDGECGFCARSVAWFHRLARREVATGPVQPLLHTLPESVRATALRQVLLLDTNGEISGGILAIARALALANRPGLSRLLTFPLLYPFFRVGYRLIARLRFLFPSPNACPR